MRSLVIYFVGAKLIQRTAKICEITIFNYIFNICMAFNNQYLIDFFKQRMVELFDNNTLDSYSVRTCNTMSMLYELKEMLKGWIACNVKRGNTVALCLEECLGLMDSDEWMAFPFYDKAKLKAKLEEYKKAVEKINDSRSKSDKDNLDAQYILHLVNSCIAANNSTYMTNLISSIQADLFRVQVYNDEDFTSVIRELDKRLSLMATEMLRRGYSRPYLYFFFKSMKENEAGILFEDAFAQLRSKFTEVHLFEDDVIIRMNFPNDKISAMDNMVDEVPAEYMDVMRGSLTGIFKKAPSRRFYIRRELAADTCSALQMARLHLSQDLDRNHMGIVHVTNVGVVSFVKDGSRYLRPETYYDVVAGHNGANRLPAIMQDIDNAGGISQEIKDRLNTALRHLRVGDEQAEMEQRFLNYWIGLEFIFATPRSGDSTFGRGRREKELMGAEESFGCKEEADMDALFNETTDILLKYRIKCMKSHLHNHEKVEAYLNKHTKNLKWHLSRIYHLRNELVHEAAIKQSIEGVTGNLRSYLVFMLNLLIAYCRFQLRNPQDTPVIMDNFFWHYELLWLKYTPEYQKDGFLSLDIPEELVK